MQLFPRTPGGPAMTAAVLLALAAGCHRHPITPVMGMLTLNGRPVPRAMIQFERAPDEKFAGPSAIVYTDDAGRFTVVNQRGEIGLYSGRYRVRVSESDVPLTADGVEAVPTQQLIGEDTGEPAFDSPAKSNSKERPWQPKRDTPIPPVYGNYSETPFEVVIEPGGPPRELAMVSKP
jgi:hypothetical protein